MLLCPLSDRGYLYPAIGVGRELSGRGHEVHAIARATAAPALEYADLPLLLAEDFGGHGALNVSHSITCPPSTSRCCAPPGRCDRMSS